MKNYYNRFFVFSIFLLLTVLLQSCSTVLYNANQPSTPLFKDIKKQQVKAEAGFSTAGLEVKAFYSPFNHLGIILNGSFLKSNSRKQYFREAGAGYYGNFNDSFVYEVYTGYGFATSSDSSSLYVDNINLGETSYGEFNRWFLQGNAGFVSENFEGGIAIRFSNVVFNVLYKNDKYLQNVSSMFLEPSVFGKVGSKNVKLVFAITLPIPVGQSSVFGYATYNISAGIQGALDF